jgi:hypothetical protein
MIAWRWVYNPKHVSSGLNTRHLDETVVYFRIIIILQHREISYCTKTYWCRGRTPGLMCVLTPWEHQSEFRVSWRNQLANKDYSSSSSPAFRDQVLWPLLVLRNTFEAMNLRFGPTPGLCVRRTHTNAVKHPYLVKFEPTIPVFEQWRPTLLPDDAHYVRDPSVPRLPDVIISWEYPNHVSLRFSKYFLVSVFLTRSVVIILVSYHHNEQSHKAHGFSSVLTFNRSCSVSREVPWYVRTCHERNKQNLSEKKQV